MDFLEPFFLFFVFFSPVHLKDYELMYADINMGETVFSFADDIYILSVGEKTFKIMFHDGHLTFQMWDFVTLLGVYVEFDTLVLEPQTDSEPKSESEPKTNPVPKTIRCVFQMPSVARDLFNFVKPRIETRTKFPLLSITQEFDDDEYTATSIHIDDIGEGNIFNELRNRFIVVSKREKPAMIFSAGHFNVSPAFSNGRVLLVIQVYEIKKRKIVMLKFLITFKNDQIANNFYEFVKQAPSCTNALISVAIPDHIAP